MTQLRIRFFFFVKKSWSLIPDSIVPWSDRLLPEKGPKMDDIVDIGDNDKILHRKKF